MHLKSILGAARVPSLGIALIVLRIQNTLAVSRPSAASPGINMFYLGNVDGKSYFTEDSVLLNWTDANWFCLSSGMRLASLESQAQWDFIFSKSNSTYFRFEYWTAGVDVGGNQQMKWSTSNKTTSGLFAPIDAYTGEVLQCLSYNANADYKVFHIHPCSNTYHVLCETPPVG